MRLTFNIYLLQIGEKERLDNGSRRLLQNTTNRSQQFCYFSLRSSKLLRLSILILFISTLGLVVAVYPPSTLLLLYDGLMSLLLFARFLYLDLFAAILWLTSIFSLPQISGHLISDIYKTHTLLVCFFNEFFAFVNKTLERSELA